MTAAMTIFCFSKSDHQKCAGTHNGGKNLAARRGHRFHAAGKSGLIAAGFHQRDGEGSGADNIGDRRAVDGAHQAGRDHGGQGGTALDFAGEGNGDLIDKIRTAGRLQKSAEHHKHEDYGGGNAHGCAEQAVQIGCKEFADALQGVAAMGNRQWQVGAG